MKRVSFPMSIFIVFIGAVIVNYFIRVSGPEDSSSSGIIMDYIKSNGVIKLGIWFIGVSLVVFFASWIYLFIRGMNTASFWKLVANNPDTAYHWFLESTAWKVLEYPLKASYRDELPEREWAGPFDLYVPEINSRVCIFGRSGEYEKTREDFVQSMKA